MVDVEKGRVMTRLENYTRAHFLQKSMETNPNLVDHRLREDQFSALCYANSIFNFNYTDHPTYKDQIVFVRDHSQRKLKNILSIGAGRGEMEYSFCVLEIDITALEPSDAGYALIQENRGWNPDNSNVPILLQKTIGEYIESIKGKEFRHDTIIYCEAIEHVPFEETFKLLNRIKKEKKKIRLIIVNWKWFHPVYTDGTGWNHITNIDDTVYDGIIEGMELIYREGSHLVVDFI